ncbi:hypothetical protein GGE16_001039 [Rhizobium leguminosarum]|uniref:Uncharacterized protein n=1 Tax=Rhizobium leguminosarum TaxID=384 RepID=A0AAE2MGI8_RHILE|nr:MULTISPECIES: hypothetical protein [Rhizobium]MBB4289023.1 hypothetical protein [Rhizobium leguminosarum]MBB4294884.1 hypothetical protein [Rhizobium leguminosarum]MBB4306277.1 hypothetical protein [Rhizobium leguminosarum]MBB4418142.1 hypothetical protein [Rhizobium leguminosarum]MBB4432987.1 hypothetical protein [Rhizobium esperanzae]
MNTKPTLEQLDLVICRMRARLSGRNLLLARWFDETMTAMEARFAERLEDPSDPAPARAAALAFVKAALHQWATRPALERQADKHPPA